MSDINMLALLWSACGVDFKTSPSAAKPVKGFAVGKSGQTPDMDRGATNPSNPQLTWVSHAHVVEEGSLTGNLFRDSRTKRLLTQAPLGEGMPVLRHWVIRQGLCDLAEDLEVFSEWTPTGLTKDEKWFLSLGEGYKEVRQEGDDDLAFLSPQAIARQFAEELERREAEAEAKAKAEAEAEAAAKAWKASLPTWAGVLLRSPGYTEAWEQALYSHASDHTAVMRVVQAAALAEEGRVAEAMGLCPMPAAKASPQEMVEEARESLETAEARVAEALRLREEARYELADTKMLLNEEQILSHWGAAEEEEVPADVHTEDTSC
jgi:hypothetical protein